jgi:hypothetical protein
MFESKKREEENDNTRLVNIPKGKEKRLRDESDTNRS